ncbi:MAG TPA: ABC transporter substrate-binding protein [Trueperaceae bacterium]
MEVRRLPDVRPVRSMLIALTAALMGLLSTAWAQDRWEMRACASPFDYPASSREDGGFNNRIAEILADQLGAHLTYEWVQLDSANVQRTLLSGSCDLIVGIAEGASNVLGTVPYLKVPFVFVTRVEDDIEIESINDPVLEELKIGTYQYGLPALVLTNLGLSENVTGYPPVGTEGGTNLDLAALQALAEGEIDLAILYAPGAIAFDEMNPVDFRIQPVTPEVIPGESLIVMSRTWTIGVRPGDESFRDRLNIALAERWDDIRAVIADFGIPELQIAAPYAGEVEREPRTSIGVITPSRTGGIIDLVEVGDAARRGALLAEVYQGRIGLSNSASHILHANAPTDAAAVRAAERLVATENVGALAGGFGVEQASALSEIAEEADVIFFNVGSTATNLRQQCSSLTFHVEASDAMLADAAITWYGDHQGVENWFLVYEESPAGEALKEHLKDALQGSLAAPPSQFVYTDIIEKTVESAADAVLLALAPAEQELFLSQYPKDEEAPIVVLVPRTRAQTRNFLRRFADVSALGALVRPATWDPALSEGDGAELNEAFLARQAAPMDPPAWTTFAAVMIFLQAVSDNADLSGESLAQYLESPDQSFELGKGVGLSFRPWNHQLRQPIYLVRPRAKAEWDIDPRAQAQFGEIVGQVPSGSGGSLDVLGFSRESSACVEPAEGN